MAIKTGDNFLYRGKKPLDSRDSFDTILSMTTFAESSLDDGHISYVKETDKHYKFNSTNTVDPVLGKWREYNGSGSATDGKVKLDSSSDAAKYLNEWIDNSTIEVDAPNNCLVVKKIDGQAVTVAEINFLTGVTSNIQTQINNLGKSMTMYGVFATKSDLLASTTPVPVDGNTAIVVSDEDNDNKQMTYIYISSTSSWTQVAESSVTLRDFSTDPIDLSSETTGVLPESRIATAVARLADVLDKATYGGSSSGVVKQADTITGLTATIAALNQAITDSHAHSNKSTLDNIVSSGIGSGFLADNGRYISILHIGNTQPSYDSQIWIDTSDSTAPVLKIFDGTIWIAVSGSSSGETSVSISSDANNALVEKSDGLFVEDLSNKVNALNIAQKTVNSELEYYYATKTTSISGVSIKDSNLINYLQYLTNITSNLEPSRYNTTGVTLKKSKTYRITFGLARATTSGNGTSAYIIDSDGNKLGNRGYFGSNSYSDNIIDVIYTPTKDISVYPALVNLNTNLGSTYYPDCSFFQITEIGREVTIDPVEYVDSTKGIEDTPVGEIIRTIGNETPKHYLMCDGSTHNIADYPYLAQYFKDTFGAINVFGGDGTTTFGVPDYTTEKKLNTQYMAPNAWASSIYSPDYAASKAFNGTINVQSNYWQSTEPATLPVEIGIDLGSEYYITRYALHNYGWGTISINDRPNTWDFEGSNDKTNWNTIDTVTNYTWTSNTPEFKVSIPGSYRYYRWVIKTCVGTGVSGVPPIAPILNQILLYYSNSNFTHIKAEPTYYMELNQAAYINQYCDVYSTDEKIVGKWVDGKPLYRKVVTGNITAGSQSLFTVNENVDVMVSIRGYTNSGVYYFPFNFTQDGSTQRCVFYKKDVDSIEFRGDESISGETFTVILEYTKTTDAPNSFDYGMIIDQFAQQALVDVAVTDAEVDKCFE